MKHEWRIKEKALYLPKTKPTVIDVPCFQFFTLEGAGNPNDDIFADYVRVLYALSYAVRMSPKKGNAPDGYFEYTVYPLEGVWDISEEAKKNYATTGKINKDQLVFKLMIRQPAFVDKAFAATILDQVKKKKPHPLFDKVKFEQITEGLCVQMKHVGPYDTEPASFEIMEAFAKSKNLERTSKKHREIYLKDARRGAPEKLETVLRFQAQPISQEATTGNKRV